MVEYRYRWVRTHVRGEPDERNVKKMEAQGWEPVPPDKLPPNPETGEHWKLPDLLDPHAFGVEDGGLRYYRIDAARLAERAKYYADLTARYTTNATAPLLTDPADPNSPLADPPKVYESEADPRSYREQLEAYYGFENLRLHPERVQELADYWANRAVKGVRFNPLGEKNPDGSTSIAELRQYHGPGGGHVWVKPPHP